MLAAFKLRAVPVNVNYRYGEDELRYLLDDADAARRRVPPRVRARRSTRSARDLPLLDAFVEVDDDSDAGRRRRSPVRPSTRPRWRPRRPTRDFGPRSADDLYILYTGGTTGMPKGVMWRAEDIFFGAFGGGNLGDAPIDRRPSRSSTSFDLHRRGLPGLPVHARHRALDGVRRALLRRHRGHLARAPLRPRAPVAPDRGRSGSRSS